MSDVFRYSSTPGDNTNPAFGGWAEGMNRTTVNDRARDNQAAIADFLKELPWLEFSIGLTITQLSTTSFRIAGKDLTTEYAVGREVRVRDAVTTAQGQVSSVTLFGGTDTDVVLTLNTGSPNVPASPTNSEVLCLTPNANVVFFSDLSATATTGELEDKLGIVKDGSFEKGTSLADLDTVTGSGTWAINTTNPRAGANALQFDPTGQVTAAQVYLNAGDRTSKLGQVACSEGVALELIVHVRHSGAAPGGSFVRIGFSWRDEAGVAIGALDFNTAFGQAPQPAITTSYTEHIFAAVAPAGAVYAVPVIEVATGSAATCLYHFDDIECYRVKTRGHDMVDIASATTINIPACPNIFNITGNTTIQTISGEGLYAGRLIVLNCNPASGGITINTAGNIELPHGEDIFVGNQGGQGSRILFVYTGTEWQLLSLSRNEAPSIQDVAGASSFVVRADINAVEVTAGSAIDTIPVTYPGHIITLLWQAAVTINDGTGNCQLAGGANFSGDVRDTMQLICDGVNWFEISRSNN